MSHLYGHILTSCFNDVILVPLAVWLYLFLLLLSTLLSLRRSSHRNGNGMTTSVKTRSRWQNVHRGFYTLLIILSILMVTLEIVRLALAKLGVGLLPFVYVGLGTALVMRWTAGFRGRLAHWRWCAVVLWLALIAADSVKLAEEARESHAGNKRKGTKYPMSDELIDVGVMVGLYLVLAVVEVVG